METQTQNQNPIDKDWFHRHKMFFATIVIVICGAGLIFNWQIDQRRKNWDLSDFPAHQNESVKNIYTNSKYGFELVLPRGWVVEPIEDDAIALVSPAQMAQKESYLKKMENPKGDCCPPYYDYQFDITQKALEYDEKKVENSFTVNGITFDNVVFWGLWTGDNYVTEREGNYYYFEVIQGDNEELRQILSTFKFTDSDSVSGWKTYTNEAYGFEFKYPENLQIKNSVNGDGGFYLQSPESELAYESMAELEIAFESLLGTATPGTVKTLVVAGNEYTYYLGGLGRESSVYEIKTVKGSVSFFGGMADEIIQTLKITND